MTSGDCADIRTNRIRRRGMARTFLTFTPRTRAPHSMAPSTATGIKRDYAGSRPREMWRGARPSRLLGTGGFTMIEILIVLTLVVILASMGMVNYRNSVTAAAEAVLKEDLFRLRDAMDQYYADRNKWPSDLADLVSAGYIREIP